MDLQAAQGAGKPAIVAKMLALICFFVAGGLLVMSLMTSPVKARYAETVATDATVILAAADAPAPRAPTWRLDR
jgi:hypothetical protein